MQTQEFPGSDKMVAILDDAVQAASTAAITAQVSRGLVDLIENRLAVLPSDLKEPQEDCYARRLVYRSPKFGYEVISMVWGPGQGTPLHDHAGIWCVDGVIEGCVEVTQFDLVEQVDDRMRFQAQETVHAGPGMIGALIPPFEYHTIYNHYSDRPSITLHVYGGAMDQCTVFEPEAGGWYRRINREMQYSS